MCSSFIIMTMLWAGKSRNLGWILGSNREFSIVQSDQNCSVGKHSFLPD